MPRVVRCGLIQAHCDWSPEKYLLLDIKKKMIAKHEHLIAAAAKKKIRILGLQELFYGPYFCAEQETRWYELTERVPKGPTISLITTPPRSSTLTAAIWANTASTTYLIAIPVFGKNFTSRPETPVIPSFKRVTPASACTFVTTATSRKAPASLASMAPKSFTTLLPPSPGSPSTSGS